MIVFVVALGTSNVVLHFPEPPDPFNKPIPIVPYHKTEYEDDWDHCWVIPETNVLWCETNVG